MTTITKTDLAGEYKTGSLPRTITPKQINDLLGFRANIEDDGEKVTLSWGFEVDGNACGIWDYKGERWSVYDPAGVLPSLFALVMLDPYETEVARFMMQQTGETKTDEDTIGELLQQFENEPRYQAAFAAR